MGRPKIEINLDKYVYLQGDEIKGSVEVEGETNLKIKNFKIVLHGEEVLGANNLTFSYIIPFFKDEKVLDEGTIKKSKYDFSFNIGENFSPTYSSKDFMCQYYLTARIDLSAMNIFDAITKLPITILRKDEIKKEKNIKLNIENEDIKLNMNIEELPLRIGESFKGNFSIEYLPQKPPYGIDIILESVEKSLSNEYSHQKTIYKEAQELIFEQSSGSESFGNFDFFIPTWSPIGYKWNTFEIYWTFTVKLKLDEDDEEKSIKKSINFEVFPKEVPR